MRQSTLLLTALVAVPLVSAKCNNVEFTFYGKNFDDSFDNTPEEGYLSFRKQEPVSEVVNCTAEAGATKDCDFHHYAMVIEQKPSINETVDDRKQIFDLVREKAAPATALLTNFNETVNWNYTLPNATMRFDTVAQYHLVPYIRCFIGKMSDCDDKDKAIDGKNVTVCGIPWIEGTERLPVDQQQYDGETLLYFGEFNNASLAEDEPQKPANEFDWKAYEDDIKEANAETAGARQLQGFGQNSVLAFSVACAALTFV